jgi:hypothetical protein
MYKYGETKTIRIVMATVGHVTSSSGLKKFQAAWFLLNQGYKWKMLGAATVSFAEQYRNVQTKIYGQ